MGFRRRRPPPELLARWLARFELVQNQLWVEIGIASVPAFGVIGILFVRLTPHADNFYFTGKYLDLALFICNSECELTVFVGSAWLQLLIH